MNKIDIESRSIENQKVLESSFLADDKIWYVKIFERVSKFLEAPTNEIDVESRLTKS